MHNDSFTNTFLRHLDFLLMSPHSINSRITLFIAALFVVIIVLTKCQISFNAERGNLLMGLFSGLLVPLIILLGSSSFERHLFPLIPRASLIQYASSQSQPRNQEITKKNIEKIKGILTLTAGAMFFLFIGGPLTQMLFRSGFLATMMSWMIAVIVAACVMAGIQLFIFHEEIWKELPILQETHQQIEKILKDEP